MLILLSFFTSSKREKNVLIKKVNETISSIDLFFQAQVNKIREKNFFVRKKIRRSGKAGKNKERK